MRRIAILLAVAACAGCQKSEKTKQAYASVEVPMMAMRVPPPPAMAITDPAPAIEPVEAADAAATAPGPTVRIPIGPPMLAYSFHVGLSLPAQQVAPVMRRHEAACAQAGYRICQVVSSNLHEGRADEMFGQLVVRATPSWLKAFREGLAGDARKSGGRVTSNQVDSEDLSRQIVDVEAQLKAKTTLRDRLQALLASRPGKLADLLDVERELARVQGEIDSTQSQLAVMRARVATSELTLDYGAPAVGVTGGPWSPLARAFGNVEEVLANSLGSMVVLAAGLAPWVLLVALVGFFFRKRLARLRWPFRRRTAAA